MSKKLLYFSKNFRNFSPKIRKPLCRILKYSAILHIFLICKACTPLESKKISIFSGFRLDFPPNEQQIQEESKIVAEYGLKGVVIELMVVGDSATGLPKISRTSLTQLSKVLPILNQNKTPVSLILHHSHLRPLFFEENSLKKDYVLDTSAWFSKYESEIISELLPRIDSYPINRLALGTYFSPLENSTPHWINLFKVIKAKTNTPLLYVTSVENVNNIKFWNASSEIGVFYQTSVDQNDKSYSRKWNEQLSKTALKLKKPIFIAQANLIGNEKLIQFKNRLRFWDENATVSGITLNNIFTRSALADTHHYFGLAKEKEFLEYLKNEVGK